jgi:hypothetical protein
VNCGKLEWKTRHWFDKNGEKDVDEVYYNMHPRKMGGENYTVAGYSDKEFSVFAGPASPRGYVPGSGA